MHFPTKISCGQWQEEREGQLAVGECPRGLLLQGGAESDYESFLMDMTSYCVVRGIGVRGGGMGSALKCNRSCTWRYISVSLG